MKTLSTSNFSRHDCCRLGKFLLAAAAGLAGTSLLGGNFTVTNTGDAGPGSLREAIELTNSQLLRLDTRNMAGELFVFNDGACILSLTYFQRGHLRLWRAPDWETIRQVEAAVPAW